MKNRILALFALSLGFSLSAGELPADITAKIVKVIVNGAGGKINCKDASLKTILESNSVATDSAASVIWTSSPAEVRILKTQRKLVISNKVEHLALGAAIAITEEGGKPKIFLHPGHIAASGLTLSDSVLKIGDKI